MTVHPFPIAFVLSQPKLKELAEEFCAKELAKPVELKELGANAWFTFQLDGEVAVKATGCGMLSLKIDVPLIRFTDSKSGHRLISRMMSYAADNWGVGLEAFIYLSSRETDGQRCPHYEDWLKSVKAVPADRFSIVVR